MPRAAAVALSAFALAVTLGACSSDEAEDVNITNDPGATPQQGDPVAPGPEPSASQ